jgi:hypothetical protein
MGQVCPFCGIDEFVSSIPLGPGFFEFICSRSGNHPGRKPYEWRGTSMVDADAGGGQGPVPIRDVREALLECVREGEAWVEYGIVEERYAKTAPQDFLILREEYGHRNLGPRKNPQFTASAYLGRALGDLRETGRLAHMTGKATGAWAYNGTISYWAKPLPGPAKENLITFEEHSSTGESSTA